MANEPINGNKCDFGKWTKLNLIGNSPIFLKSLAFIERCADHDVSVLIEGETGTGKELAARAIHYLSARRDYPFVPINCGAIPDNLIENELFGHVKGAFTDAKQTQSGLIANADGGTLFLDEIEALSVKGQVTLLRFIEEKKFKPLGAKAYQNADIRIIAASNAPLADLVKKGQFRQDLWYRLMLLQLRLPPLRERGTDIQRLGEHFMRRFRNQYHQPHRQLHQRTQKWMSIHPWPGNVRELEHFIHRQFLLTEEPWLCEENSETQLAESTNLPDRQADITLDLSFLNLSFNEAKNSILSQFEQRYLIELITQAKGNVTQAAQMAQKERSALGKLLRKYHIDPARYRDCC